LLVGILQQITGINSVFAYATVIFKRVAGEGEVDAALMQTMMVGFVNLASTIIALLLIDRVGRRPLLLCGTAGIALSLVVTAYGFSANDGAMNPGLVLAGLLGFVGCFAFSLGPGMWVLFSEIFPNRVRGLAISCVGFVNSSVCVVVQFLFPWQMETQGGTRTFLLYALFAAAGFVLLLKMLPETRGRSLEELEDSLVRKA
jgi:SP family arabinose:H+ symporter-like MFS transporter